MSETRIEFRCSEKERKRVNEKAKKAKLTPGQYLLSQAIYQRGRGRSGLKAKERESLCRICTCLNKISDGIKKEENRNQIIEECKALCQYSK